MTAFITAELFYVLWIIGELVNLTILWHSYECIGCHPGSILLTCLDPSCNFLYYAHNFAWIFTQTVFFFLLYWYSWIFLCFVVLNVESWEQLGLCVCVCFFLKIKLKFASLGRNVEIRDQHKLFFLPVELNFLLCRNEEVWEQHTVNCSQF